MMVCNKKYVFFWKFFKEEPARVFKILDYKFEGNLDYYREKEICASRSDFGIWTTELKRKITFYTYIDVRFLHQVPLFLENRTLGVGGAV